MLEEARLKKQGTTQEPRRIRVKEVVEPAASKAEPQRTTNVSQNDLPFSDDMYDHLKYVIGKLTARMKVAYNFYSKY